MKTFLEESRERIRSRTVEISRSTFTETTDVISDIVASELRLFGERILEEVEKRKKLKNPEIESFLPKGYTSGEVDCDYNKALNDVENQIREMLK